ncbi:ATP-dependent DNA helicase [Roseburia sp. BX1005]|uniref:ATP-dependent DNA helicase n=1 Tax=Roseburia zhanii TaxID=2763064 RepID=A0A923LQ28_9FIRM|nr:ATP-dependent DNA helicase [Roseburia zhanii]MBC5715055.1 ATP-dependent DNA helicase [Roseburia zhanii]
MQEQLPVIKVSVRNLVEFILRSGDIDNRISLGQRADAMQEGSRMHRKIQRRMGASYQAEVPLAIQIETAKYVLLVEGRADGIILEEQVTVDEIKGVYQNLEYLEKPVAVHKAQAMCYAYIYASQHELEEISVQMTYCNLDTEEIRRFKETFLLFDLENWFYTLIGQYAKWADFQVEWKKRMVSSITDLQFPYAYRRGQKELAGDVYRTILRKKNLFIQAPTGTGKTLSTIFPSVKAVGEGLADKIFYLTAKTITGTVARETFSLLEEHGYRAKIIQITAKEKMCLCEEMDCNPIHCPYAKGHYDRVNDAVYDLLMKQDLFSREVLLEQAENYQVCPFEMSLDAAIWSDDIICDYNYAFDPNVYLKRFFGEGQKGDYIFLVDEAHNLVERGREMYSAELYKEDFLAMRKLLKDQDDKLIKALTRCNQIFLEYKRECDTCMVCEDDISLFIFALMRLAERLDLFLRKQREHPKKKEILEFYLNLRNFLNIYERVDERYVIYTEHEADGRFKMRLFCVDPSYNLQECLDKGKSTIFFSATLLPVQYYKEMLSTREDNYAIYAQTSFEEEQKLLLIGKDVSSRYKRRNESEFQKMAAYIADITAAKAGNYMVFFPSYKMLDEVYEQFLKIAPVEVQLLKQESGMTEVEREEFLQAFANGSKDALVAFCVLGGIFGEGIDLKQEQLIGAVIIGTGLPQIGNEREILKAYYDKKADEGFDYAYRYPGMNKVLQAAGRVIRTIDDRGVIALLDERFLESSNQRLFPREWTKYQICDMDNVSRKLSDFWQQF